MSSTDYGANKFLKYQVERRVNENKRNSVMSSGKEKKCVVKMVSDMCLRRRMIQTRSKMAEVWKWAARKNLFLLCWYDLNARRMRAKEETESAEELRNQMDWHTGAAER